MPDLSFRLDSVFGHLSVQGQPVTGLRRFGVPPGGCFQSALLGALNLQVGNPFEAHGLEIALGSFSFTAPFDLMMAFGPWALVRVGRTRLLNGYANRIAAGSLVTASVEFGARAYFAFGGGVLGSGATVLSSGGEVSVGDGLGLARAGVLAFPPLESELMAMPGDPAFDWVFGREFAISPHSDRVGVRLMGSGERHSLELPSRPAVMGTVQVTPSGELIIFGPEGPTIGGYPQAATLLEQSLNTLAQLRPGDKVCFRTDARR